MNLLQKIAVSGLFLALGACVQTQQPLPLEAEAVKPGDVVAVGLNKVPDPRFMMEGSQGLLDLMIASAVTDQLNARIKNFDTNAVRGMENKIVDILKSRNTEAFAIDRLDPALYEKTANYKTGFSRIDYSKLKQQHDANYLLLIEFTYIGVIRPYYGFIPTGAPEPYIKANAKLVDLSNNKLFWYQEYKYRQNVEGDWDDPPSYPALTSNFNEGFKYIVHSIVESVKEAWPTL